LAFEKVLDDEDATVMTADCYGTMFHQLPAFPCIGFTRLNNMGLGGICESDLQSAVTHILFQGLAGKPGFISDPTVDESNNSIILAHCLGTTKMDGPEGTAAPYRLRSIMERREGAVPQVMMRIGQKVTQAKLIGPDLLVYFTGEIIDTPDTDRGCRTKITVKVDGEVEKLWHDWSHGLHRVTCYGDLTKDLARFCRFKGLQMIHETEQTGRV
jgi:L-fucose isomerase-like protein